MASNPFGHADPLAPGQAGATGAPAGFGSSSAASNRQADSEYEVVDIPGEVRISSLKGDKPKGGSNNKLGRQKSAAPLRVDASGAERPQDRGLCVKKREVDQTRNWPAPWLPIAHHNISKDVPLGRRSIARMAFLVWLCTVAAFVYAAIGLMAAVALAKYMRLTFSAWVWVVALVPVGCFGSWHLWYKRFYWAMVTDGALSFCMFFTFFMIHIGWCAIAAIAPNFNRDFRESGAGGYTTGFLTAVQFFKVAQAVEGTADEDRTRVAAIIVVAGAAWWVAVGIMSLVLLVRSYRHFRGRSDAAELQRDTSMAQR